MKRGGHSRALAPQESNQDVDVLRAAMGRARAGRGAAVLVSGPAGIGKTHLLRAAAVLARGNLVSLHVVNRTYAKPAV